MTDSHPARLRKSLEQLQERLDPHRDAALWGEVIDLIQAMTTGPLDATKTASIEVEKLRAENAALKASMQQLLEQPPAAYMRHYMGSMDFMVHEPWCIDGLSPGWVPLYKRPSELTPASPDSRA